MVGVGQWVEVQADPMTARLGNEELVGGEVGKDPCPQVNWGHGRCIDGAIDFNVVTGGEVGEGLCIGAERAAIFVVDD